MAKMKKNKAVFDRCVEHVKGKVKNPYAACNAVGAGRGGKKAVRKGR